MVGAGSRGLAVVVWFAVGMFGLVIGAGPSRAAAEPVPGYVVGYATAALERADPLARFRIEYADRLLRVDFEETPDLPLDAILRQVRKIEGVDKAELYVAGKLASKWPDPAKGEGESVAKAPAPASGSEGRETSSTEDGYDFFLLDEMFDPLLADPRWPRFSASHLWFLDDDELERVGSANFGETFVLVRSPRQDWGRWEVGFQAGVFSVFDLEASSADLVNSDFLAGLTFTHHAGDFTTLVRIYHQSSHLGDEYLLRNRVDRVNLSFEVLDLLVAFEPAQWVRIYGGGGVIVHREPALERGILQTGIELSMPEALAGGYLRPVASSDLQFREESDWKIDASVRAGVQLEHPFLRRSKLRILAEFYSGRSPNGQFYDRRIKTIGLGIHLGF